jgi:large subunit ribosomal protein L19
MFGNSASSIARKGWTAYPSLPAPSSRGLLTIGLEGEVRVQVNPMGQQQIIESINAESLRKNTISFGVGDTVNVSFFIVEGDKKREQVFQGVVLARTGRGIAEMVTIRKIVDGVGVERIFPLSSPLVGEIELVRRGDARRSKLYYLRDRQGKSQRLRDRRRGLKHTTGDKRAQN